MVRRHIWDAPIPMEREDDPVARFDAKVWATRNEDGRFIVIWDGGGEVKTTPMSFPLDNFSAEKIGDEWVVRPRSLSPGATPVTDRAAVNARLHDHLVEHNRAARARHARV